MCFSDHQKTDVTYTLIGQGRLPPDAGWHRDPATTTWPTEAMPEVTDALIRMSCHRESNLFVSLFRPVSIPRPVKTPVAWRRGSALKRTLMNGLKT